MKKKEHSFTNLLEKMEPPKKSREAKLCTVKTGEL